MTSAPRRPRLIAVGIAVLLVAGAVTFVLASRDEARDDAAARSAAERYLKVLSDDSQDPGDLVGLVSVDDPSALERADVLLAEARERISDVTVGESREVSAPHAGLGAPRETAAARSPGDRGYDRIEQFDVGYRLAGERHRATIELGLPASGGDDDWLVLRPLDGQVDWNSAAWGTALLDVDVGNVEVTKPGRTTYEPDAQFVHPAVYPVRASVGPYFTSAESDLTVAPGTKTTPLPTFDLAPTPAGTDALTGLVRAAFEPCSRGTAYCPVLDLLEPWDGDLPPGWWLGLSTAPTVTVDGTAITLKRGEFRYLSPSGVRAVAFDGSATVTVDPFTQRLGVSVPLNLTRH